MTRSGRALVAATGEVRQAAPGAEERLLEQLSRRDALESGAIEADRRVQEAERTLGVAGSSLAAAEEARDRAAESLRAAIGDQETADDAARAAERAVARREEAADQSIAVRRAELSAELRAERRMLERVERERAQRARRRELMRERIARNEALVEAAEGLVPALREAVAAIATHRDALRTRLDADQAEGDRGAEELRVCAREEAQLQGELRRLGEVVTAAEVTAQRARDSAADAERELGELAERLGLEDARPPGDGGLTDDRRAELVSRVERLAGRRERLGPVNPLAGREYEEAVARVEELESQREDLETALAEVRGVIRDTDRRIRESFEETFAATARNFEEVVEELFPGGRGRLRLVAAEGPRPVLGGEQDAADAGVAEATDEGDSEPGVEVEVTPAGKSMRRLSLLSGGERSLVALAFLFAVFLARPCPFYVLDEVEAALDDLNIDRFLRLVRRCADRAQFIVVTHQKRTMDAADRLYGVSMGADGVSKVVSRRLSSAGASHVAGALPDRRAAG